MDYNEEAVLNVFRGRYPEEETLTTADLEEELSVKRRTVQNYVNDLKKKNRLVLESEGKPNHWRLADTEPTEPVYSDRLAKAKRRGKQAGRIGELAFLLAIGTLAAAGLVTSNHVFAKAIGVYLPLIDADTVAVAVTTGVLGSLLFAVAFVALVVSVALPRVVKWRTEDPVPDSE